MIVFKGGSWSSSGKRSGVGKSFVGLIAYLQQGHRDRLNPARVAWTSTRNLDDLTDPRIAAKVMRAHAEQNRRVHQPAYHFGLSLAAGEHLKPEQWDAAVDRVLKRMGLDGHQAVVIAHGDTDQEHVHIVVNRVGEEYRAWNARHDMVKANEAAHELEREHRFRRTGGPAPAAPELASSVYQESLRTGRQPLTDRVRDQAGVAFARAIDWRDLEVRLAAVGFRVERAERGSGLIVTDGNRRASLSRIDRSWSGPKLAERFGESFQEHRQHFPEPPTIQPPPDRPASAGDLLAGKTLGDRAQSLIDHVATTRATFTRADIERAAFYEPESRSLVREALRPERLIDLGRDATGARRYTTVEYFRAEERVFSAARLLAERQSLKLDPAAVVRALERTAPQASDEQRAAVLHATTDSDLAQIVGRAGAGKTTIAAAIAEAYREQGFEVLGTALAGKAAEGLEREAGVRSRTLASLEHAWREGLDRLSRRTVLLVDEAGLVDTRLLSRVLAEAQNQGAKVVLLGDPGQLKAIGAGDAFRGLLEEHPSANLEAIRRQVEPWQRQASMDLAGGRVASALDAYAMADRLHWTETRESAHSALVAQYLEDRRAQPDSAQLIVAYRNAEARVINEAVRAELLSSGELPAGVRIRDAEYSRGDRLLFLKNDHQGREVQNLDAGALSVGVKNGTLATVESVDPRRFVVRLDDGRRVEFDPERYDSIAHGYAVTIHKAQGATVERAYALADPMMNRNAAYVALTRHRQEVHLYADRVTFGNRRQLDRTLSRESRKDLARDYAAADLERLASRVERLRAEAERLRAESNGLSRVRSLYKEASLATSRLESCRQDVERFAAGVYVDPGIATRALLADPQRAIERLSAGEAAAFGELRGRTRFLLGDNAPRIEARQGLQRLWYALQDHRQSAEAAGRLVRAATKEGLSLPEIQGRIGQLGEALLRVTGTQRHPERALEDVVRRLGFEATRAATSLLPRALHLPVSLALRAVERLVEHELSR